MRNMLKFLSKVLNLKYRREFCRFWSIIFCSWILYRQKIWFEHGFIGHKRMNKWEITLLGKQFESGNNFVLVEGNFVLAEDNFVLVEGQFILVAKDSIT